MFGKKFLQTSSSVVLSASLVSMVQNVGVFADDNAGIDSEVSPGDNAEVLSVRGQNNDIVENILGCTDPDMEESKDDEMLDNISDLDGSNKDDKNSVESKELRVAKMEDPDDAPGEDSEKIGEKSPEEKLQDLEMQREEVATKVKDLKKFYEEEIKKLGLRDKELVKAANKIKDEMGMWRLRTWDEIRNDTPLVLKSWLLLCLLELVLVVSWCIVSARTGISYLQVQEATCNFVGKLISKTYNSCVNAGKFVKDKFSEGFDVAKELYSRFVAQSSGGYQSVSDKE